MKLSFKFFCIAYIVVLLAAGIPSAVFIQNSVNKAWSAREEMVISGENYAVSSFYSLAELSSGKISEIRRRNITTQIRQALDSNIDEFGIENGNASDRYKALALNKGVHFYFEKEGELIMESACKVEAGGEEYCVFVRSYFSELRREHARLWRYYSIAMLFVAAIGGVLLYFIARKITDPLKKLTEAANDMAAGNYGKTVVVKTGDIEINDLARSFNEMSAATENSLREIKAEAEKRERFVANFTHEMKTPMTSIIGYAQLLESYELSEREKQQAAASIFRESKRLESLSLQLLELFVTQNEEIELKTVLLETVVERLKETMRFSAEKYGCILDVALPRVCVLANGPLILSLFYNLIDNAFKACEKGGRVSVRGDMQNGRVRITVSDTGRGIAPEHIKHLTEPFYREDKARSRRLGGAGIGLALCKEIAALHGTELAFSSERGKGTTVTFSLSLEVTK